MHLLICGLGSIGRRHLRHFRSSGVLRIDAYRTGKATLSDEGQPAPDNVYDNLTVALAEQPDAVVIANPTSMHVSTALAAVSKGCHVLIEKPVGSSLNGCADLVTEVHKRRLHAAVASNFRFHPNLRMIREWIESKEPLGEVLSARAHFGAYLPDWHPWEDYRRSYAARAELGGGAALTNIHEIDYCLWLFGPAERSKALALGRQPLGTNVDEACVLIIRHAGGSLSTITLSLVQKPTTRNLEIVFTGGTLWCDLMNGTWTVRFADGRMRQGGVPDGFEIDHTYRDQAASFLQAVRGQGDVAVTLEEGIAALKLALSAQECEDDDRQAL